MPIPGGRAAGELAAFVEEQGSHAVLGCDGGGLFEGGDSVGKTTRCVKLVPASVGFEEVLFVG